MSAVVRRGRWTPADRAESVYQYLPVDIPAGTGSISVTLGYDTTAGVLDLGCFGPAGFRGWSGGARTRFTIDAHRATPGYLPGPLESGTWQVVLGLHQVRSAGVAYEVTVELSAGSGASTEPDPLPNAQPRRQRRQVPAQPGMRWLAGDLHCHTVHSDGVLSVGEVAALAAGAGLDFLAVTDHNTVSHHRELPAVARAAGITLIPGQEVTTASGHANAFGDIGWIDFRNPAADWVAEVERRGGLLSVNHPIGYDCSWRHPVPRRPPLAEIWHSSWRDRRDGGALAWWLAWGTDITPVGGSDWHRPGTDAPPGSPTTWVACAGDDVLAGLAAGRTAINAGYEAPLLVHVGADLVAMDAEGAVLVCPDGRRTLVREPRAQFDDHPGPHLLEDDDRAVLAIAA